MFQKYWWWASQIQKKKKKKKKTTNQMAQIPPSIIINFYYYLFGNFMERLSATERLSTWQNQKQGENLFSRAVAPTDGGTEPRHWRRQLAKLSSARRAQIWCLELRGPAGEGVGNTNESKCRKHRQACCAVAAAGRQRALDPFLGSVPSMSNWGGRIFVLSCSQN